jgi:DNA polymerase-3 subunit gamma/tau
LRGKLIHLKAEGIQYIVVIIHVTSKSMTLYLKYRPQKISELDLEASREMLKNILGGKSEVPHAFLFSGPRGTGKTSAARILAKAINCEKMVGGEPCGQCSMCEEISSGISFDVVEIDAASNRGIDEIRELRDGVKLAPMRAKFKVYIIDEVHMLTTEAANALLKTLEEPPAHVVFVLCTTEPERLPQTVVSRCLQVMFTFPKDQEVLTKLHRVVEGEKAKIDDEKLMLVVKAARGSFRDAIKILEQVIMSGGDVNTVLGMVGGVEPSEFLEIVRSGNVASGLEMVNKLVEGGGNIRGFIERCVEACREELLELVGKKGSHSEIEGLISLIGGLEKAYERTKASAVAQLPLEIFVIESVGVGKVGGGEEKVSAKKAEDKKSIPGDIRNSQPVEIIAQAEPVKVTRSSAVGKYKLEDVVDRWGEVMKQVRPKNHSVEALLRSTRPVGFDGERLELEVFYKFHKDKLESEKCRQIVEGAVTDVFGVDAVKLFLRLGEKKQSASQEINENIKGSVEEDIIRAAEEIFKVEAI